jgi:hypothetical protein
MFEIYFSSSSIGVRGGGGGLGAAAPQFSQKYSLVGQSSCVLTNQFGLSNKQMLLIVKMRNIKRYSN